MIRGFDGLRFCRRVVDEIDAVRVQAKTSGALLIAAIAIASPRTAEAEDAEPADVEPTVTAVTTQAATPQPPSPTAPAAGYGETPVALRVGLFAVGGAGVATFAALGVPAYIEEAHMKAACGQSCSSADVDGAHARVIIGDVSLGAGLAAAATAAWLTWIGPTHTRPGLGVVPTSHGIGIGYVGVLP